MIRTTFAATGVCALFTAVLAAQTTPAQPTQQPTPGRNDAPQNVTMTGCLKPWDASTMGAPMTTPGAAKPGGEAGMTGATTAQQFVLTNAMPGPAAAPMPTGSASGTPTPPSGGAAMGAHSTYLLKAQSASVDLAGHVGHKVELTGTVAMDANRGMGAKPGAMGTTGATDPRGAMGTTPGANPTTPGATTTPAPGTTRTPGMPGATPTMPGATTPGTATTPGAAGGAMAQQHGGMTGQSTFTVTALKMIDKTCS